MRFVHLSKWTRAALALSTVVCGGLALSASFVPLTACTTQDCEPGYVAVFGKGEMTGPDEWETNPIDGIWQPYTPELTITLQIPQLAGRTVTNVTAYISPVPNPNAPLPFGEAANNFATASGNLAEFQLVQDIPEQPSVDGSLYVPAFLSLAVHNDSCASYFVRVVVDCAPLTDGGVTTDASTDSTTIADSSTDANDAATDGAPR